MIKYTLALSVIAFIVTAGVGVMQDEAHDPRDLAEGKIIYEEKCAQCHGNKGDANVSAADRMEPRPRDFTRGRFKIRSTESGEMPTDDDLFNIITVGMPGTMMPGWSNLSGADRRKVVAYLKTFSRYFSYAEGPPRMTNLADKIRSSDESIALGREIYEYLECSRCHGQEGRADGPSAPGLLDEWDRPTRPADLTESWNFRGGNSQDDLFLRLTSGLDGTPMPSVTESFELDEEVEEIGFNIEDGEEVTPEEREKYETAMTEKRLKLWHLVNYVRSLSPARKPEVDVVLRSILVEGPLPEDVDDPRWDEIESNMYPLVGQVIVSLRNFTPSVDAVFAKSMYNDQEVAFLLTWNDPTLSLRSPEPDESPNREITGVEEDTTTVYDDMIALQFPEDISNSPEEPPFFLMGNDRRGVYLWRLRAAGLLDSLSQTDERFSAIEGNARGMNAITPQPSDRQDVYAKSKYSNGQYRLLVKRSRITDDENDLQFEAGRFIPIAFFAWDGSNGETGTRSSVSSWYSFRLEEPVSRNRFLYPPLAAILVIVLEAAVVVGVRRRTRLRAPDSEGQAPDPARS